MAREIRVSKGHTVILEEENKILFFSRAKDVGAYTGWYESSTRSEKPPVQPDYIFDLPS